MAPVGPPPVVMQSPVTRVTVLVSQAASGLRGAGNCLQMTHRARHGNRFDTLRQSRPCLKYTCQQCDLVALKTMKHSTHTAFIGKSKIKMDLFIQNYDKIKQITGITFDLKPEQRTIIDLLLQKRNVMAILPTGYGKSVLFAALPLLLDQVTHCKYIYIKTHT